MWMFIFLLTIVCSIVGIFYLTWAVRQFAFVKKLAGDNRKKASLISFAIIALMFAFFTVVMSMVNAIVILLFVISFRLIFGLIGIIVKNYRKKPFKTYWQGWMSLLFCAVYLIAGCINCFHVDPTIYDLKTDKNIGGLKVAMFADSHLGTTFDAKGFGKLLDEIMAHSPDIVLIVGDYVDDGTEKSEMIKACEELGRIDPKYGVRYVFGNHDRGYNRNGEDDFTGEDLVWELEKNHVHVLSDMTELIDDRFYLVGREDASSSGRMGIEDLVSGLDPEKYMIVMDHQPTDYDNEAAVKADLVLSGHTHGGQMFPVTYVGEWFDINDNTYGFERRGGTDFIVTSGISDWEILFKTATKSEYVIINID